MYRNLPLVSCFLAILVWIKVSEGPAKAQEGESPASTTPALSRRGQITTFSQPTVGSLSASLMTS